MRRLLTLPLVCLMGYLTPAAAAEVPPSGEAVSYRFDVYYDGRRIGEHGFDVRDDGKTLRVTSSADFEYKLLFVRIYHYEHRADEVWQQGCLTTLESATDDNGTEYRVRASTGEGTLKVSRLEPTAAERAVSTDCPATFAYWDRQRLRASKLINAQTGEATAAVLIQEGETTLNGEPAVLYRLEAEGMNPIRLWYRQRDDRWVRLETRRDGGLLEYRLASLTEQPVSAIEEDPGV